MLSCCIEYKAKSYVAGTAKVVGVAERAVAFVRDVEQRLACAEAAQVFTEQRGVAFHRNGRIGGDVWSDDDVRHFPKRAVGGQRCGISDIQAYAGEMSVVERGEEGRGVDDLAPGDVDENRAGFRP
jgi:hypothetical protein